MRSTVFWFATPRSPRSTFGGGNRVASQFFLACPQQNLCMLLGHSVLVHETFEPCMFLRGAFRVAHRALLTVEFVTAR
jgi:hypothetical protein